MSLSRTSIEPEQTLHLKRNQNNTASTAPISGFFNVLKQRRQWKGSIHGICNNLPRHSRMQVNEQPHRVFLSRKQKSPHRSPLQDITSVVQKAFGPHTGNILTAVDTNAKHGRKEWKGWNTKC